MKTKILLATAVSLIALTSLTPSMSYAHKKVETGTKKQGSDVYFSINGSGVKITPIKSEKTGKIEKHVITLRGVKNVIATPSKQEEQPKVMLKEKFIELWPKGEDSFEADPPSSELSFDGKVIPFVATHIAAHPNEEESLILMASPTEDKEGKDDLPKREVEHQGLSTVFVDNWKTDW